MDDGWWMMNDGWWMMDDGCCMMDDWWGIMVDDDDVNEMALWQLWLPLNYICVLYNIFSKKITSKN